ncbi:MAG: NYN domain-containing protein, partial [Candidatus Muirbacterium halophilum]|nr:NYN domain-containing protein [Candidatus Muirbacterium halophilum]
LEKVAIFVDWENFKQDIYFSQKQTGNRVFNFNDPKSLVKLFSSFLMETEKIYRIFFYTSYPFEHTDLYKTITERKNLSKTQVDKFKEYYYENQKDLANFYTENKKFLDVLACEDFMAVRAGELKITGLHMDGSPVIVQKQVDMLIGLDIAHVSYNQFVDKVMIFSKDTDIKPALKTARINGIQTIVACLENGYKIPDELRKHSDNIRKRTLKEIFTPQNDIVKNNNNYSSPLICVVENDKTDIQNKNGNYNNNNNNNNVKKQNPNLNNNKVFKKPKNHKTNFKKTDKNINKPVLDKTAEVKTNIKTVMNDEKNTETPKTNKIPRKNFKKYRPKKPAKVEPTE